MTDFTLLLMTYNAASDIEATLSSFVDSLTLTDQFSYDILFVDDASSDLTTSLISNYINAFPVKSRLLINKVNLGISNNLAFALSQSVGNYTIFFGQGDLLTDEIMQAMHFMKHWLSSSPVKPSAFMFNCLDEHEKQIGTFSKHTFPSFFAYLKSERGEKITVFNTSLALYHSPVVQTSAYLPHSILFSQMVSPANPLVYGPKVYPRRYIMSNSGFTLSNLHNRKLHFGLAIFYFTALFNSFFEIIKYDPLFVVKATFMLLSFALRSPLYTVGAFFYWVSTYSPVSCRRIMRS